MTFGESDVSVTLTGRQWSAIILVMTEGSTDKLSDLGRDEYRAGALSLARQVASTSKHAAGFK